jgi:LmbE family N-acetylglucosaminyl deacetylase
MQAVTLRNIFGPCLTGLCLALLLASGARAQAPDAQLRAEIRSLTSTLRVLQITAHPGDEDGALLMSEARGEGARVTLLTLTRGERIDNRHGILAPGEQGLQRTMEQLASDRRYGVEQRFARMVDFGFARTADEVFDRWGGHNTALGDMVRVIRETRPQIIIAPFDLASPDGDGQHAATAILVREAFRAAADPKRFPEQLTEGVEPWQAKRVFALARLGGYSVVFNAGRVGAMESESWQQQAERALAAQHSQEGMWHGPREALRHYRLIDASPDAAMGDGVQDFAEGLHSGLGTLADAMGAGVGAEDTLRMRSRLAAMGAAAAAAMESVGDGRNCIAQLAEYLRNLRDVEDRMALRRPPLWLRAELAAKRRQAEDALLHAAGVRVEARLVDDAKGGTAYVLVPGHGYEIQVQVAWSDGVIAHVAGMELKPEGGRWTPRREWNAGETSALFRGKVPADAPFTRPQFLLESDADGAYVILDERNATRALPPPSLQAVVELEIGGEVVRASAPVQATDANAADKMPVPTQSAPQSAPHSATQHTLVIAPPMSVIVEPRMQWNRRTQLSYGEIEVRVRSNLPHLQNALLSVHPPSGWRAEPEHEVLDIETRGEEHSYRFYLIQERGGEGTFPVRAVVRWGGVVFDQGYRQVRGADDQMAFDYRPSNGSLVSAQVDVPEDLEIGYLGVDGDPIPAALRELGVKVSSLDREDLMRSRLEKYWAIVLGPSVVDERTELAEARSRLLHYAEAGGVVVILAQSDAANFASNAPVPYSLELGTARVTNEASAVEMADEHDDAFMDPNEIGSEGFRGWSEERGRCFAQRWDPHYEALLSMRDIGQPVQEGALLRARYGRGSVVYTGLSFDRQLSAGVPGAMRLLVNLLSAGAELHR